MRDVKRELLVAKALPDLLNTTIINICPSIYAAHAILNCSR